MRLRLILPPIGYLLVGLLATWPLMTHLQGWVPGTGDWGQNMWALWWTRQALLNLSQSPFYTNYLFYPEGVTLLFHPLDVSDGLLSIPFYGLFGGDVAYNLMILLSFVLGGWGTYLLALHLIGHRGASFVAGLVFILSPYHFLRIDLGHLNLSTLQWIPFYALFLFKFVRSGSKHSAALAVFFLVFNALNSWYYVVYCGLFSLAVLFWPEKKLHLNDPIYIPDDLRHSSFVSRQLLSRLTRVGIILVSAMLILSPLLIPMLRLLDTTILVGAHNPLRHSVDALSFWVPGPPSFWAKWFENSWISYAAQNREPGASAYLGYTVLGLSVIGLFCRQRRRQTIWWLFIALGFAVLALGPQLQINGQITNVSLPYQWLANLVSIFSITGIPGRFVVMTSLALAMLVAYGLIILINWLSKHKIIPSVVSGQPSAVNIAICLVVGLLIGLEYLAIPIRLTRTDLPEFYDVIASDTTPYAILDIKWDANFLMHAQTRHGKPLVGGWLARLPERQAAYLEQDGLDKVFLYLLLEPEGVTLTDPEVIRPAIQTALAEHNVRYIIDHNGTAGSWLEQLVGWPVIYKEGNMIVYGSVE